MYWRPWHAWHSSHLFTIVGSGWIFDPFHSFFWVPLHILVRTCRSTRRIQGWLAVRNSRFHVLIVSILYSVLPPVLRKLSTFLCLDFNEKSYNDSLPLTLCPSGICAQIVNSLTMSPTDDIKNRTSTKPHVAFLSGGPDSGIPISPFCPGSSWRCVYDVSDSNTNQIEICQM